MTALDRYTLTYAAEDPASPPIEYADLSVWFVDRLLAEKEAPRHGIAPGEPLLLTAYWCWAALTRMGENPPPFEVFRTRIMHLDTVRPEGVELDGGDPETDPTHGEAPTPSP